MQLKATSSADLPIHPSGIYPAVCVDVIDLGMCEETYQGQTKERHKVRLVFEMEERKGDGIPFTLSKRFSASLHPKSRLYDTLTKWRGKPILADEVIDMRKLIGVSATLLVGSAQNSDRAFATIDAISKPTKRLTPSGTYDPSLARQRIVEQLGRPIPGYGADTVAAAELVEQPLEEAEMAVGF